MLSSFESFAYVVRFGLPRLRAAAILLLVLDNDGTSWLWPQGQMSQWAAVEISGLSSQVSQMRPDLGHLQSG